MCQLSPCVAGIGGHAKQRRFSGVAALRPLFSSAVRGVKAALIDYPVRLPYIGYRQNRWTAVAISYLVALMPLFGPLIGRAGSEMRNVRLSRQIATGYRLRRLASKGDRIVGS